MLHEILPSRVDALVSLMKVEKVPDSTYDMIGGLDQQIKEVKEVIEITYQASWKYLKSLGIAQPKGVLLYGPPGTGKNIASKSCLLIILIAVLSEFSGSETCSKNILERELKWLENSFVMAREHAPSIIFMDEIDFNWRSKNGRK